MVKKGDTLFEIAKKYGVDLDALIAANPQIADPNVIDVGMKVKIPLNAKPLPVPPVGGHIHIHKVVSGDTLWKLSKAWNLPLKALIDANPHIKNPSVLMLGDIVYIPKTNPDGSLANANPQVADLSTEGKKNTAPKEELLQPIAVEEEAPIGNEGPLVPVAPAPLPVEINQPPVVPEVVAPEAVVPELAKPEVQKPTAILPEVQKPEAVSPATDFPPAQKPELPLVATPGNIPHTPIQPAVSPEATKGADLPIQNPCPPMPDQSLEQFYAGLYGHPMIEYPYGTGPQAQHPFHGQQMPSVQAAAGFPQLAGMPAGYPQGMPGVHGQEGFPGAAADCGCGGGMMPNLPYALGAFPGAVPMDPAGAQQVPYGAVQNPWYPEPHMVPCYPVAVPYEPLSTYATPYVNPYFYPGAGVSPAAPGDCGCGGKGRDGEATINSAPTGGVKAAAPVSSKTAKKPPVRATKPSKKREKAVLHSFLERKGARSSNKGARDSTPWINL